MKRIILLLLPFYFLFSACDDGIEVETHINSYNQLREYFKDVPNTYRTVPFWVWNTDVTKEMIEIQLKDYAQKGFGGVFVHPRYGLITEYGSEKWYDLVAYAVKVGRNLDLDVWLYDENSFPSGFAGGLVPANMPGSYNEGHALRMHRQNLLSPEKEEEYFLIQKREAGGMIDITDEWREYEGVEGAYYLFEKVFYPVRDWYAGFSYVDLLKPGVTEKFIEVTMTGYEERFKLDFGMRVPGVFTDEPNIAPQGEGALIRWTPDLFKQFEKRWGYRLQPHLNALLEQTDFSNQVRHNYFQLLLELFIERWSKPWYEYTEDNNLLWTGHYWEHGWPSPHHGPDHMAMYAWHQVPGVDMLFNNWHVRPDQFGNVRAIRELNSVGNQLGRIRKLSETYGASGWELTFEDMKRNGDWQYVMGVNLMNQHLSYQSITGDRKHDFPQSFSYHSPYWDEYPILNEYYARLSLALSSGRQVNKTLILEPTTSAWMYYVPEGENNTLDLIKDSFAGLLDFLEHEQIGYDLGSENIIKDHGSASDGLFIVGERAYNQVLLPKHMHNLNRETLDILKRYLEQGGKIISIGEPITMVDGIKSNDIKELSNKYADQWVKYGGFSDLRFTMDLRSDDFTFIDRRGDSLFHMRREFDDGHLLFLTNSGKMETTSIRLNQEGKQIVEMDLFTGEIFDYPCVYSDGIISFKVELEPAESKLLFIGNRNLHGQRRKLEKWRRDGEKVDAGDISTIALDDNAINLDYCRLIMYGDTTEKLYFYDAQTKIFNRHGFEKNPWVSASQYMNEIVARDTFTAGSGFKAEYPFFVDSEFKTKDLRLVVERPQLYQVTLNGIKLEKLESAWWLDREFGVFKISKGIQAGNNTVTIEADPMSVFCELEPVYLVGDFDVLPIDTGWLLARKLDRKIGSWKKIGMPFYSGRVKYTATYERKEKVPVKVVLGKWHGTVARVEVNGKLAGHIFSPPYELRLDEGLKAGMNEVSITVYGSLKNLLGPHHNVSRKGIVTPWSFKYAPANQPSGNSYDLVDYGLFEPFYFMEMD